MHSTHKPLTFSSSSPRLRPTKVLHASITSFPFSAVVRRDDGKEIRIQELTLCVPECAALRAYTDNDLYRMALGDAYALRRAVRVVVDSEQSLFGAVKITQVTVM